MPFDMGDIARQTNYEMENGVPLTQDLGKNVKEVLPSYLDVISGTASGLQVLNKKNKIARGVGYLLTGESVRNGINAGDFTFTGVGDMTISTTSLLLSPPASIVGQTAWTGAKVYGTTAATIFDNAGKNFDQAIKDLINEHIESQRGWK